MTQVISDGVLSVGTNLSVRRVERSLREAEEVNLERIEIDLRSLRHVEVGAGWRLGNAVSAWSRDREVIVELPPDLPSSELFFKAFTRSGLGLSLATHPVRLLRDGDATQEIRDYYTDQLWPMTGSVNVLVPHLDQLGELRDTNYFAEAFARWAPRVGLQQMGSAPKVRRIPFLSMVREAIANVYDHAYKRPFVDGTKLSYLSLRRYQRISTAPGSGSLVSYLESLETPEDVERLGFVELVVVDDGCGIAARQVQDAAIYARPIEEEDAALAEALATGKSVKTVTRDAIAFGEPGYGFTYIADGLRRLRAYAELRSGRRLLTFDASSAGEKGFVVDEEMLGRMPGTALHIILPLDSDQLRIFS